MKALPISLPGRPRPVAIFTLKGRSISPVAQLFIECAREVAKPLAPSQERSDQGKKGNVRARRPKRA